MTREEAIEMMKAKLACMTREVSGADQECNSRECDKCPLNYEQGNMGEQKEWLRLGIEALENQKTGHWINRQSDFKAQVYYTCSVCNALIKTGKYSNFFKYCPNCGAKMKGEQK